VIVAASAPHREEAFAGAREAIDPIKAEAPIWEARGGVGRGGALGRRRAAAGRPRGRRAGGGAVSEERLTHLGTAVLHPIPHRQGLGNDRVGWVGMRVGDKAEPAPVAPSARIVKSVGR
jgi:hypothetical protein